MNPKPARPIDKLLAELAEHRASIDSTDATDTHALPSLDQSTSDCEKSRYSSEARARKAGHHIMNGGANTSYFRAYFCHQCKAWHLTSTKNFGSGKSTKPTRNASHNRREKQ
jgi:hypothetical protein